MSTTVGCSRGLLLFTPLCLFTLSTGLFRCTATALFFGSATSFAFSFGLPCLLLFLSYFFIKPPSAGFISRGYISSSVDPKNINTGEIFIVQSFLFSCVRICIN